MGVGPQGEARVAVAQHSADRLDVHAVLQRQGGEGVTEVVQADGLQPRPLENLSVEVHHAVRVVHLYC